VVRDVPDAAAHAVPGRVLPALQGAIRGRLSAGGADADDGPFFPGVERGGELPEQVPVTPLVCHADDRVPYLRRASDVAQVLKGPGEVE
jgi:hypothetical protein